MEQGGVEALLEALPTAQPATRSTIIELLRLAVPAGDARARLVDQDAVGQAAAACARLGDAAEAERCRGRATSLREALAAA